MNWQRILILIGFLAAVILIGYGLYFLFLRPAIPTQPTDTTVPFDGSGLPAAGTGKDIPIGTGTGGTLGDSGFGTGIEVPGPPTEPLQPGVSTVARGGVTQTTSLTTSRVYQPTLSSNGQNAIFYDKTTGLFYQVTAAGNVTPISSEVFFEVENITWAPNKQKAVLEYPDGSNIVYNFETQEQVTLPKHWKDFSFSTQGNDLVFKSMGNDPDNRWLAVSSADGSKATQLENLGSKDASVYPSWSPSNQIVAMYTEEKSFDSKDLFFVGLNGENFKSTTINGLGFEGQWSTQGDKLLYSVYSSATDYKPTLWIVGALGNSIGQNKRNLKLTTWVDKCTFAGNDTVYCAVPTSLATGAGIYKSDLNNSPTDIYKIDLTSGFKTKIATPEISVNIDNILVTKNQRTLYFTDQDTGLLYKINLK